MCACAHLPPTEECLRTNQPQLSYWVSFLVHNKWWRPPCSTDVKQQTQKLAQAKCFTYAVKMLNLSAYARFKHMLNHKVAESFDTLTQKWTSKTLYVGADAQSERIAFEPYELFSLNFARAATKLVGIRFLSFVPVRVCSCVCVRARAPE